MSGSTASKSSLLVEDKVLEGGVIMPKLTNETAKWV